MNGIRTRFTEIGRGDPLVLIHGGHYGDYMSAQCWDLNLSGLSKHFRVITFDKLGMGYTDNPVRDEDYTMEATVDHAHHFLLKMKLKNINLIGHSRGAFLAARLAIDYPDIVKSLVIVDTATLAPDDGSVPVDFYAKIDKESPLVPTRESIRKEPEMNSYSTDHVTDEFIEKRLKIALLPKILEARRKMVTLKSAVFLPSLNKKKEETLGLIESGSLKQPTIVIWSLNDPSAPVKIGIDLFRMIASKNEYAEMHLINQAGHYSYREHPAEFNRVVASFLMPELY